MWAKLEARYTAKIVDSKLNLLAEAHNKKYGKKDSMSDHVGDTRAIFSKLESAGHEVDPLIQVSIFLASLQDCNESESALAAIRTLGDNDTTWGKVTTRLMDEFKTKYPKGQGSSSNQANGATVSYAKNGKQP
jgi:gag-polypeptide of LTR copia-type